MSGPREYAKVSPAIKRGQDAARAAIAAQRAEIEAIAHAIHADPEPPGAEVRAAERLVAFLAARGFTVEPAFAGLPAAFRATRAHADSEQMRKGLRHPHLAILAEYAAAPDGHTFGRNLAAGVALAAAVGLEAAASVVNGTVTVVGCPGTPTATLALAETGVFAEADVAFGARPAPAGSGALFTIDDSGDTFAGCDGTLRFTADADSTAVAAVAALRAAVDALAATFTGAERLLLAAGETPGDLAVAIRAPRLSRVNDLAQWLEARADQAAAETGAVARVALRPALHEMVHSRVLLRRVRTHADAAGLRLDLPRRGPLGEPDTWGPVSYDTPTASCRFPIGDASLTVGTPQFAVAADTPEAYAQMFRAAESIALAGVDVLTDINIRSIADAQLVKAMRERGIPRGYRRWTGVHPVLPKPTAEGAQAPASDAG